MSIEVLKSIFDYAAVVLLGLTFLAGLGVLITGNVINARQARQLQQFDVDITKAKTDLGRQQERAANADARVAGLEKDASDAKATQQRVETELAKQKERTASAEKAASDAALALARLKQPRYLSPEQQETLIATLTPFAGQHFAFAVFPDPEPLALLRLLDTTLKSAGWVRVPSQIGRVGGIAVEVAGETAATIFDTGIEAFIAPDDSESVPAQSALCSVLRACALSCETHRTPQLAGKTPRAITISIGKKP
jgi:hypothetical protein